MLVNNLNNTIDRNTKQALNLEKSIWISASAGSGKTTILVKRIITLLLNNVDIKKIICITYTKNGANEMKERIYRKLSKWMYISDIELEQDIEDTCKQNIEEIYKIYKIYIEKAKINNSSVDIDYESFRNNLLKRARTIFINLIDNSDELRIFTIHSFCQQILNKFPIEAGIQPNFEIVEGEEQKQLFKRALNQFLLKDENSKYLKILDYISPRDFEDVISKASYKFDDNIFSYILIIFYKYGLDLKDIILEIENYNNNDYGENTNDENYNDFDTSFSTEEIEDEFQKDDDLNFGKTKNDSFDNKQKQLITTQKILQNFIEQINALEKQQETKSKSYYDYDFFINGEELLNYIEYVKEKYKIIFVKKAEIIGNEIYKFYEDDPEIKKKNLQYGFLENLYNWLLNDFEYKLNHLDEYLTVFLTDKNEIRKKGELDYDEAERCYNFYQNYNNLENLYATVLFSVILLKIKEYYNFFKRQKNLLDYDDLISITGDLLKNKPSAEWVKYKLDNKIEHILLDEAQDTSSEQWDIIKNLVDEFFSGETAKDGENKTKRTLFVVGDEKQSIFGFQGANPKLFRENFDYYKEWFERSGRKDELQKIELQYSFRSCQNIIKFVNEIFKDKEKLIKITTEEVVEHKANRQKKGYIELWPLIDVEKQESINNSEEQDWIPKYLQEPKKTKEELLAECIVEKIESFFLKKRVVYDKDNVARPLRYSDIMLLLTNRDYELLYFLVKELNKKKIPNSGFDRFNLFENIFIKDLISLLNFVMFPRDDFNLATLIKSPILNMTEDDLREICNLKNEKQIALIEVLKDYNEEKYNFLKKIFDNSKNKNGYDFFIYCLEQTDIKQNIIDRAGEEFEIILTDFLSFVKQFTKNIGSNLLELLSFVKNNEYSLKKDLTNSEDLDQVKITTKHSSKGSEALIVFILDAQQGFTGEKNILNFKMDNGKEFPIMLTRKTNLLNDIKSDIDSKLEDESYRLFYVAITRACNELYICALNKGNAKTKQNENGEESVKNENNFYHISQKALKDLGAEEKSFEFDENKKKYCFGEIETEILSNENQKDNSNKKDIRYNREYFKLQQVDNIDTFEIKTPSQFYNHSDRDFKFDNINDKILLGNTTHKLLEILPNIKENKREDVANIYLNNMLKDFDKDRIEKIKNNVFKILNNENYKQFFNGKNSRAEVPVIGKYDGKNISGQIDRLIEFDDKVVIIDYKNTFKDYKNKQEIPQQYIKQLQIYKTLLQKEYKNKTIECYILLINFIRLIKID